MRYGTRDGRQRRFRRMMIAAQLTAALVALGCGSAPILSGQTRVPTRARDVSIRGAVKPDTREAEAELRAYVATPFGRIPVSGHVHLRYTCDGRFSGTVNYARYVKVLAALKGVSLVRSMDGTVTYDEQPPCRPGPELVLRGVAITDSFSVTGYLRAATDSIAFSGLAWWDGEAQRGVAASVNRGNRVELRYNMYEATTPPAARRRLAEVP